MGVQNQLLKSIVAAFAAVVLFSAPVAAQETRLDGLLSELSEAEEAKEARRIAKEIELEWRNSGSASADLLLKRGRDALDAGEIDAAIGHLTALTDHAPEFATGWHMRATAFAAAELYGPALADLQRALALEPRHYNAMASLGAILAQAARPEMAKEAFARALAIHPFHAEVLAGMEHVKREIGGRDL